MKLKDCITEKVLLKGKISNLTHNYRVQALFPKTEKKSIDRNT